MAEYKAGFLLFRRNSGDGGNEEKNILIMHVWGLWKERISRRDKNKKRKEGTRHDEHWVMKGNVESPYRAPETNTTHTLTILETTTTKKKTTKKPR